MIKIIFGLIVQMRKLELFNNLNIVSKQVADSICKNIGSANQFTQMNEIAACIKAVIDSLSGNIPTGSGVEDSNL